jgi:hypothetical protein
MDRQQEQDEARQLPKCPICGEGEWRTSPTTNPVTFALADGTKIEAQALICGNCAYIRFHAHSTLI